MSRDSISFKLIFLVITKAIELLELFYVLFRRTNVQYSYES